MLLGGGHTGDYVKNPKNHCSKSTLNQRVLKKLHGMFKNILREIGYVCFINIMKSTRNTFNKFILEDRTSYIIH